MDEGDRNAMKYWADAGLQPTAVMKTSSMEALCEMVALGLGVTILSDMVFRPWPLDGRRIHSVEVDWPLPLMEVGLAWQRDTLSPASLGVQGVFDALWHGQRAASLNGRAKPAA